VSAAPAPTIKQTRIARSRRPIDEQVAHDYLAAGWWREHTLLDDFLANVEKNPHKAAVVSYRADAPLPTTLTYGQLGVLVDRCAAALIDHGIEKDDIVSLQLPNGWEVVVLCLAVLRAGAIPNPLPPLFRHRELRFMLDHARSKMLVVPSTFRNFSHAELGMRLASEIPGLTTVVVTGDHVPDGAVSFAEEFLGRPRETRPGVRDELQSRLPATDDVVVLLYTSGTTGVPKAAMHTHNTIWSAGEPLASAVGLTADDTAFMASTIGHLTGFYWGMMLPMALGQTLVYQDVWQPEACLRQIESERVTWTLSATPFALDLIEQQKTHQLGLDSFRVFVCGGAPIPASVAVATKETLGVDLISLWGMTEVGICSIHSLDAPLEVLSASDGMPVERMNVRIVDPDLNPVPDGHEGRLQARGPGVFVGYLGQTELFAQSATPDGWFDTGDLGRRTPDGGIRITGRAKDIILRGGENIPVAEIESALFDHPKVREVVVVAYPDPRLGERGCAVVVPRGEPPTLRDLTEFLDHAGMAKQYWPERLEIVEELPKTPAGKVQKFVLRKRFATDHADGRGQ
jgi:cyclohexanecarboxylate-CoA ligase